MLAGQVHTPADGELELAAISHSLLQNPDTLGIGQTHERTAYHPLEALDEGLVDHLVEELQVVLAVVECPLYTILDEVFLEVHQVVHIDEGHLGLYHPELSQVAGRIGVFGTEGGTEGVDGTQGSGSELALKLSADSERSLLAEEIIGIDNLALLVLLQVVEVLGGHLEHLSGTLTVAGGNQRCMEIEEAMLVEIVMDGHRHVMTDAHHGSERIGA